MKLTLSNCHRWFGELHHADILRALLLVCAVASIAFVLFGDDAITVTLCVALGIAVFTATEIWHIPNGS